MKAVALRVSRALDALIELSGRTLAWLVVALVALVNRMNERGFRLLDIQYLTPHLERFGAIEISREAYLRQLAIAIEQDCQFFDE